MFIYLFTKHRCSHCKTCYISHILVYVTHIIYISYTCVYCTHMAICMHVCVCICTPFLRVYLCAMTHAKERKGNAVSCHLSSGNTEETDPWPGIHLSPASLLLCKRLPGRSLLSHASPERGDELQAFLQERQPSSKSAACTRLRFSLCLLWGCLPQAAKTLSVVGRRGLRAAAWCTRGSSCLPGARQGQAGGHPEASRDPPRGQQGTCPGASRGCPGASRGPVQGPAGNPGLMVSVFPAVFPVCAMVTEEVAQKFLFCDFLLLFFAMIQTETDIGRASYRRDTLCATRMSTSYRHVHRMSAHHSCISVIFKRAPIASTSGTGSRCCERSRSGDEAGLLEAIVNPDFSAEPGAVNSVLPPSYPAAHAAAAA